MTFPSNVFNVLKNREGVFKILKKLENIEFEGFYQ